MRKIRIWLFYLKEDLYDVGLIENMYSLKTAQRLLFTGKLKSSLDIHSIIHLFIFAAQQ